MHYNRRIMLVRGHVVVYFGSGKSAAAAYRAPYVVIMTEFKVKLRAAFRAIGYIAYDIILCRRFVFQL